MNAPACSIRWTRRCPRSADAAHASSSADAQDQPLADVIIGNPVENSPGFRYVRQPGQRRVYVSNIGDLRVSTAFGDWIERDLLQAGAGEIDAVNIRNYSLDRSTGRINPGDTLLVQKAGTMNGRSTAGTRTRSSIWRLSMDCSGTSQA